MDLMIEETGGMSLHDYIYLENVKDRRIILNDGIDSALYETLVMQVRMFNAEDEKNNVPIDDRKPIEIFINSYGGVAYDGFAAVNAIITSKTPVHTHCDGYVMSMGLAIFLAGHKRFGYPFSNYMYHEVSGVAVGKNNDIERQTAEHRRIQKMYDKLVLDRTLVSKAKLTKTKKNGIDWFFDSDEALDLGIIHEIVSQ